MGTKLAEDSRTIDESSAVWMIEHLRSRLLAAAMRFMEETVERQVSSVSDVSKVWRSDDEAALRQEFLENAPAPSQDDTVSSIVQRMSRAILLET